MGLSSKRTKTKSVETIAPSDYSKPYIDQGAAALTPAYDATKALREKYMPQLEAGANYYGKVAAGDYLSNESPDLARVLGTMNQETADGVNGQFSGAGRYGSDYHATALARQIGDNEAKYRLGNYQTERGYQNDAALRQAGLLESIIGGQQQDAGSYANNIAALLGKYMTSNGQSTTKSSGSLVSQIAKLAQVAAMAG